MDFTFRFPHYPKENQFKKKPKIIVLLFYLNDIFVNTLFIDTWNIYTGFTNTTKHKI